jgi:signal transduction histidine kinase
MRRVSKPRGQASEPVPKNGSEGSQERLARELNAVAGVVGDMLRGEVDDAETEKRVLDACMAVTDSIYGMIGWINEHGRYDTTTYSSRTLQDCAFPEALSYELSTGMEIRGIWGWPMLQGKPLLCNDLQSHPASVGLPKGHVGLDCFLGVPLKRNGDTVGMVAVASKMGGYVKEDEDTLVRLASIISVSRQHREALASARRTSEELEELVNERTRQLEAAQERLQEMVRERTDKLHQAQGLLARREKLTVLGQLAGGVGHELRNPLAAIKNATYFLNMALESPDADVKETLGILKEEIQTSERIIDNLLGFARPKLPCRRAVDINGILEESRCDSGTPGNVQVVSQLGEDLPTIQVDPDQMREVFDSIILNGVQSMPEGGRLAISSDSDGPEQLRISFSDTGVGIPEENLEKLFEPLFTTKAKSIGLGLAVASVLVEGNGGSLEVESEVGKGSTFTVRLPLN